MTRKTRKNGKTKGVHTIPQLRRLFESIEEFVDSRIAKQESKESLSKEVRKEWKRLFHKELDKKAADSFIEHRMIPKKGLRATRKHGGNLSGAPIDHTTRPGIYLASGTTPMNGHIPLSNGGGFGRYVDYVGSGFKIPEIAQGYDPVPNQQPFPIPYASTGSNMVGAGRRKRKIRGGNALLTQAFSRPFTSSSPPGIGQDMQSMWNGSQLGASPHQVQNQINQIHNPYRTPTHPMQST